MQAVYSQTSPAAVFPPSLNQIEPNLKKQPLIQFTQVVKKYATAAGDFQALKGITASIFSGEFVGILGKSRVRENRPS